MEAIFEQVFKFLSTIEGSSLTIAVVLEFAFRMIPSQKPLSILYVVAAGLKKCGELFIKVGQIMDKVLPQKIK